MILLFPQSRTFDEMDFQVESADRVGMETKTSTHICSLMRLSASKIINLSNCKISLLVGYENFRIMLIRFCSLMMENESMCCEQCLADVSLDDHAISRQCLRPDYGRCCDHSTWLPFFGDGLLFRDPFASGIVGRDHFVWLYHEMPSHSRRPL